MPRRLIFNAFAMNGVSHVDHGVWRHPDTRQTEFKDLSTWIDLVHIQEKGRFDGLCLGADSGGDIAG